jgi:hypothetical protein
MVRSCGCCRDILCSTVLLKSTDGWAVGGASSDHPQQLLLAPAVQHLLCSLQGTRVEERTIKKTLTNADCDAEVKSLQYARD